MRIHTIIHCGSPGTTHHGVRKSNLSFLKRHQPLIVEHPKHVTSGERNTMCGNISRNSGLTGPQKVHVSLFWRMKRHLAKLKAAKATSHGKSTVAGHGESTTGAKGLRRITCVFGQVPSRPALGWWFCVQGDLR
jgi:hypothetical protein